MTLPARKLATDLIIHLAVVPHSHLGAPGYAAYTPPAPIVSCHHHSNAKPVPEHGRVAACGSVSCACRSLHEAVLVRRSKSEIALAVEAALVAPHPPPLRLDRLLSEWSQTDG